MARIWSGCKRCRKTGEKLCSNATTCALNRSPLTPGQHGKKHSAIKLSEYGKQLREKQKAKFLYGLHERQFRRFFEMASKAKGITGEELLNLLERRLDNVLFRLKLATSRTQARQMIVHGHILINNERVKTPSYLVKIGDEISLSEKTRSLELFMQNAVDKRLNIGIKVPEWLELRKQEYKGIVLRFPQRLDVKVPLEEHLIVELYSK